MMKIIIIMMKNIKKGNGSNTITNSTVPLFYGPQPAYEMLQTNVRENL